ncbi:MAG: hypothetical protein LBI57_08415 [Helicobacteraceae bacterium]|jgi:hypothetical protein|nr:hypothetical protein [Helicobacteraceae bacterium]
MRRIFAALTGFGLAVSFGFAAKVDCDQRYAERGVFSVCPPTGWKVVQIPGVQYRAFFGDLKGNAGSNINFETESFNGSLKEYVDLGVKAMESAGDVKLIKRENFTAKNVKGERIILENSMVKEMTLRLTLYIFELNKSTKMAITCIAPTSDASGSAAVFEEMINSFQKL